MFIKLTDYETGKSVIINTAFIAVIEESKTPPYSYPRKADMDHCTIIWMNYAAPDVPDETMFYTVSERVDEIAPMVLKYVPIKLKKE